MVCQEHFTKKIDKKFLIENTDYMTSVRGILV